jgi:two-component system, NarL family, sensor histidine kinase DevS
VRAIGPLPRGRGLLGALIRDARPLRLRRIADDPRSVGFPAAHPPMESFLGVPVALRGEVFGNLYLTEKVGGDFSAEDEQVAQTLAAQAAVAIETAHRYEEERRRVAELESLHELAQAILATLEIDQLLPLVARQARRLTGADTVGVALREGDALVFRFAHGLGALALEALVLPVAATGVAERLRALLGAPAAEVAPLVIAGEQVGVLAAVGARPFDAAARRLLATFSSHAAIALGNARAFADERERLLSSAAVQAAQARERAAAEGHRRAIEAQEAERARIARELHDEAGQVLTALALHMRALEDELLEEATRVRLSELRRQVNAAASSLRDLATELRPSGLREHGLQSAITRQAARVAESSAIEVDLALDGLPEGLPEQTEIALFRVVQEALTNVARHSGATRASVLATALGGRLRLVVEDEGRGFDPAAATARLGLAGIRERVELLGGQLRIESSPGAGTAVIVDLVLEP